MVQNYLHLRICYFALQDFDKNQNLSCRSASPENSVWGHAFLVIEPSSNLPRVVRKPSGSVIECLTRDRGGAGSNITGVTALCP